MASTLNEIRRNEGRLPATAKMPDKAIVSHVTLMAEGKYAGSLEDAKDKVGGLEEKKKEEQGKPMLRRTTTDLPKSLPNEVESRNGNANQTKEEILHLKQADPGTLTLPISVEGLELRDAMCDLGAAINILPMAIYRKLRQVELLGAEAVIQLVNGSCIKSEGVLMDVVVKVKDLSYLADLYVVESSVFDSNRASGVLIGRPFLCTARTIIDVFGGTISLEFNGRRVTFDINGDKREPVDAKAEECFDNVTLPEGESLEKMLREEMKTNPNSKCCMEEEVANWCEEVHTLSMTDEEILEAIDQFCAKPLPLKLVSLSNQSRKTQG